ncbi:MAG: hypothetical protein Q9Q13_12335 [Acidobacteriota bacterium]|nr:hypothetical protein [Acidobacteriota bacterium]
MTSGRALSTFFTSLCNARRAHSFQVDAISRRNFEAPNPKTHFELLIFQPKLTRQARGRRVLSSGAIDATLFGSHFAQHPQRGENHNHFLTASRFVESPIDHSPARLPVPRLEKTKPQMDANLIRLNVKPLTFKCLLGLLETGDSIRPCFLSHEEIADDRITLRREPAVTGSQKRLDMFGMQPRGEEISAGVAQVHLEERRLKPALFRGAGQIEDTAQRDLTQLKPAKSPLTVGFGNERQRKSLGIIILCESAPLLRRLETIQGAAVVAIFQQFPAFPHQVVERATTQVDIFADLGFGDHLIDVAQRDTETVEDGPGGVQAKHARTFLGTMQGRLADFHAVIPQARRKRLQRQAMSQSKILQPPTKSHSDFFLHSLPSSRAWASSP